MKTLYYTVHYNDEQNGIKTINVYEIDSNNLNILTYFDTNKDEDLFEDEIIEKLADESLFDFEEIDVDNFIFKLL